MKRDRIGIWLDANDETVRWLKYEVPVKERGKVVREALKLYRNGMQNPSCITHDDALLCEALMERIKLAFPDRELTDELVVSVLSRGIFSLKKEEEEKEKLALLNALKEV